MNWTYEHHQQHAKEQMYLAEKERKQREQRQQAEKKSAHEQRPRK